jgi:hypothetical protein
MAPECSHSRNQWHIEARILKMYSRSAKGGEKGDPNRNPWLAKMQYPRQLCNWIKYRYDCCSLPYSHCMDYIYSNGDLDLWPNDPKINRVLPLPQGNNVAKFVKDPIYRTEVIVRKWPCCQTKLGHMIPLWKGKNLIYFGVITIIPFNNLYRRAYFVMHTFLVPLSYNLDKLFKIMLRQHLTQLYLARHPGEL